METDERRSPTPLRPTLTRFPPSCHGRNERSERGRGVRWVHDIFWSIPCILLLHVMRYGVSFSESFRVHVVHVNPAPSTVRPSHLPLSHTAPASVTRVPLDPSLGCMFGESGSDHGNDARGGCSLRARPSFVIPVPSHSHPRSVHYIHL